jgi:glycosyltransferase involved in cell wall biosynthesis
MEQKPSDILLSVCCVTYNHGAFIAQAIEGFLMQRTTFKYEILIGEDCSTDGTAEIVRDYALRYPEKIILVTSASNVGANQNVARVIERVRGMYIALCDGDDYWTDPNKLQKQVDFLEKNPEYAICCHYAKEIDHLGNTRYISSEPKALKYTYQNIMVSKQVETSTASMVIRNSKEIREFVNKEWYPTCHAVDKFFKLTATFTGKMIYVMPEVMSCYRRHPGGIWSTSTRSVLKNRTLSDFNLIINHFEHNLFQKFQLLIFYFKRYFVFEYKTKKLNSVLATIKAIF